MQVYDTCRAGAIQAVRVGRSAVAPLPAPPVQSSQNINTLKAKRDGTADKAHVQKLTDIGNDDNLNANEKRAAVAAENESYKANEQTKDFYPDDEADQRDRNDLNAEQNREPTQTRPITDENQDGVPDETQDIIHITLAGGEKRSILRNDIVFHDAVLVRGPLNNYPNYAQRGPAVSRGQYAPSGQYLPQGQVMAEQVPRDGGEVAMRGQAPRNLDNRNDARGVDMNPNNPNVSGQAAGRDNRNEAGWRNSQADSNRNVDLNNPGTVDANHRNDDANNIFPVVGVYLVEYFNPESDVFVQKIYDAATFARYFKASLN